MALGDKNIIITPNKGQAADPKIVFSGADSTSGPNDISLNVYPTDGGTLSFEGSSGQLFSITNNLSGSIFSVNDISGIPSIDVDADGTITLAEFGGNVGIGTSSPAERLAVQTTSGRFEVRPFGVSSVDLASTGTLRLVADTAGVRLTLSAVDRVVVGATTTTFSNSSGSEAMRIDSAGNIGIGTSTPGAPLEIYRAGPSALNGVVGLVRSKADTSSLDTQAIRHTTGTTWEGLKYRLQHMVDGTPMAYIDFNPTLGGRDLTLGTNNLARLSIDISGNVGIGTSVPASRLHVLGSGATAASIRVGNTGANGGEYSISAGIPGVVNTGFTLYDYGASASRLHITSAGLVGIGTSVPGSWLHVNSNNTAGVTASVDTSIAPTLLVTDSNTASNGGGSIVFGAASGSWRFAAIKALVTSGTTNSIGDLAFSTRRANADATLTETMRLTAGGNVGIGTSSPSVKMDVAGHFRANSLSTTGQGIELTRGDGASTFNVRIVNSNNTAFVYRATEHLFSNTGETTEFMRITSAGNVGIGTSAPTFGSGSGLEIERASANATLRLDRTTANISAVELRADVSLGVLEARTNTALAFGTNSTERMRIDTAGNVGIGTSAPNSPLTINTGNASFDSAAGAAGTISFGNFAAPGTSVPSIVGNSANANGLRLIARTVDANVLGDMGFDVRPSAGGSFSTTTNNAFRFSHNGVDALVITRGGNVGIGTSAPTTRLHVAGGHAIIDASKTDSLGTLELRVPAGALDQESALRFHGTFGGSTTDTGMRYTASIRSGFNAGVWGNEYLDVFVNNGNSNDGRLDAGQQRVSRFTRTGLEVNGLKVSSNGTIISEPNTGTQNSSARTVLNLIEYRNSGSAATGAIVFIAPNTVTTIMHRMEIEGLLYTSGPTIKTIVQGYRTTGNWSQTSKINLGIYDLPVRWGVTADGRNCLILGDVATTWSYPHISVARAMFSHTNGGNETYAVGWSSSLVTSLADFTNVTGFLPHSTIGGISNGSHVHTQGTAATTWTIDHNLGQRYVNVEVIGSGNTSLNGTYDYPTVTFTSTTRTVLTFTTATSGYAVINSGNGPVGATGPTGVVAAAGDGTAALPGITFAADTNTGIYRPAADVFAITTGGTEAMRIDSGGTTTLAGSNTAGLRLVRSGSTIIQQVGNGTGTTGAAGTDAWQVSPWFSATPYLHVTGAGDVGIGTSSPATKLGVAGTVSASAIALTNGTAHLDINGNFNIYAGGYSATISTGEIVELATIRTHGNFRNFFISGRINCQSAHLSGIIDFHLSIRSDTLPAKQFSLFEKTLNMGRDPELFVYNDTNADLIHICARVNDASLLNINAHFDVYTRDNYQDDIVTTFNSKSVFNATGKTRILNSTPTLTLNGNTNTLGSLHLWATNSVERMRIDAAGNVGIGTNAPTAKTQIAGAASATTELLRLQSNTNSAEGNAVRLGFSSQLALDGQQRVGAAIDAITVGVASTHNTALSFSTMAGAVLSERMRIDSAGRVTMPNQPAFHAKGTGTQSFSGAVNIQIVTLSTAVTNIGNHYNTSTSRFTVPVTGTYFLYFKMADQTGSTGPAALFYINGVNQGEESIAYYTAYKSSTANLIRTLTANDVVEFRVTNYNSTTFILDRSRTAFGGFLIG
jgi:hypothetical protein